MLTIKDKNLQVGTFTKDEEISFTFNGHSSFDKDINLEIQTGCGCTDLNKNPTISANEDFTISGTITKRSKLGKGVKVITIKESEDVEEMKLFINYNIIDAN